MRGNSTSEPYIVAHNCLLAHASTARLYKKKYQAKQRGFIGLNVFAYWLVHLTKKTEDVEASQRANDFFIGWFIEPLVFRDYSNTIKNNAGLRVPSFTAHESQQMKGSFGSSSSKLHKISKDFILYFGGSARGLDWCPRVQQKSDHAIKCEYLPVVAHPPASSYYNISTPLIGRGVVRIWCLLHDHPKDDKDLPRLKKPRET